MTIQGPHFNLAGAAEYCGYRSAKHFGDLLKDYDLPRTGPKQNRFARSVLDAWMANPNAFRRVSGGGGRRKVQLVSV